MIALLLVAVELRQHPEPFVSHLHLELLEAVTKKSLPTVRVSLLMVVAVVEAIRHQNVLIVLGEMTSRYPVMITVKVTLAVVTAVLVVVVVLPVVFPIALWITAV